MKTLRIIVTILAIMTFVSTAMAVPSGKELEYTNSKMGKVTFSGTFHADKGKKCNDCHPAIFKMKKGKAKIMFSDHNKGAKFCFACHNGTVAFRANSNCQRCHKK